MQDWCQVVSLKADMPVTDVKTKQHEDSTDELQFDREVKSREEMEKLKEDSKTPTSTVDEEDLDSHPFTQNLRIENVPVIDLNDKESPKEKSNVISQSPKPDPVKEEQSLKEKAKPDSVKEEQSLKEKDLEVHLRPKSQKYDRQVRMYKASYIVKL